MKTVHRIAVSRRRHNTRSIFGLAIFVCVTVACLPGSSRGQSVPSDSQTSVTKSNKKTGVIRTLDAINIEGEIAVPQVLFITSRDYRRYRDGLALKFRMSSLDVARSSDLPARLRFVAKSQEEGQ